MFPKNNFFGRIRTSDLQSAIYEPDTLTTGPRWYLLILTSMDQSDSLRVNDAMTSPITGLENMNDDIIKDSFGQ